MPAWRAAAMIGTAIASVQAQSFTDWELIVVDDASPDATPEIVRQIQRHDPRIRLLSLPSNKGAAQARNRGIEAAQGRYIAFLDADDLWLPEKLEKQLKHMAATSAALSYSSFWRETGDHRRLAPVPASVDYRSLLRGNVIGCLTAIYDRQHLGKVYMPDLRMRQDYGLWLKILRQTPQAYGLQEPLAIYRRQAASLSSNRLKGLAGTWRMYREAEGIGRLESAYYLAHHVANRARARLL